MLKHHCPNCGSDDITVTAPPSVRGTDFWDNANCNQCGYPDFASDLPRSTETIEDSYEAEYES